MTLKYDNCQVLISDNQIDCEYLYLQNKKIQWSLQLDSILIFNNGFKTKSFNTNNIKEFWFEIDQRIQRANNLTQIANAYIILNNSSEPIKLFNLCVREEMKLSNSSKSYEFTQAIIKKLSERYKKPFSYKLHVETKKKDKNLWISLTYVLIAAVIAFLLALWIKK
ncbi:hypothetical protein [Algibacter mikhailovii]|uniref:Uncharacterized protein n=1 Tax=Algibacter mikhailovii TaxID=425498 RepID=A0A918REZ0_9FLAO|nr:hypothetical protein [Algibacter mikhailovii]GGZ94935.1 hypothetical protein GCM10007028_36340 [Algibacter mikhailovii]